MSKVICPYGIRFQEDGKLDIFPAAEVSILGNLGEGLRAMFLLDSGATTSILPLSDAEALGMSVDFKNKMIVRGFSGESAVGYMHHITLALDGMKIEAPIIFVDANVPRVLGRAGIFPKFAIVFDEAHRRTGFFSGSENRKALDILFK